MMRARRDSGHLTRLAIAGLHPRQSCGTSVLLADLPRLFVFRRIVPCLDLFEAVPHMNDYAAFWRVAVKAGHLPRRTYPASGNNFHVLVNRFTRQPGNSPYHALASDVPDPSAGPLRTRHRQ